MRIQVSRRETPQEILADSAFVTQILGMEFQAAMWTNECIPTTLRYAEIQPTHVLRDVTGSAVGNTEVIDN